MFEYRLQLAPGEYAWPKAEPVEQSYHEISLGRLQQY